MHVWLVFRMEDWKLIQGSAGRWNDWYPVPGEQGDATPVPEEHGSGPDNYQLFNIKGRLTPACFCPSLISLVITVDVKHRVCLLAYLLTYLLVSVAFVQCSGAV